MTAYRLVNGGRREALVRAALTGAREAGRLPAEVDVDVVREQLNAAVLYHVGTRPDDQEPGRILAYFMAIMKQFGLRP